MIVTNPLDGVGHRHSRNRRISAAMNGSNDRLMQLPRCQRSCRIVHDDHRSIFIDDRKRRPNRVSPFASTRDRNIGGTSFNQFLAFAFLSGSEHNNNMVGCSTAHSE